MHVVSVKSLQDDAALSDTGLAAAANSPSRRQGGVDVERRPQAVTSQPRS
jgi:hypothetical protein